MKASHLFAGGGTGGFVATLTIWLLHRAHVQISPEDGVVVGSAALALGTGLAQRIELHGLRGLFTGLWKGTPAA